MGGLVLDVIECRDSGLVGILDIMRQFIEIIHIAVPIILLVMIAVQFTMLTVKPDDKNGVKSLINKFIAAAICFLLPFIVNLVLTLLPDNFQIASCWDVVVENRSNASQSGNSSTTKKTTNKIKTVKKSTKKRKITSKSLSKYNSLTKNKRLKNKTKSNTNSSKKGMQIVNYAKSFVGQRYVWGGTWNGELPYTGTDCSGFVRGVFRHFGIELPRTSQAQFDSRNMYTVVDPNDIRAGDIVFYEGHVAILTGNGEQIVHASSPKNGIMLSPTYKTNYNRLRCIGRIKGVN